MEKEFRSEWEFHPGDHPDDVYSWKAYHATINAHKDPDGDREDFSAFLPDPDEVKMRIASVLWLQHLGFPTKYITSIMIEESPSIKIIRILIPRIGPVKTILHIAPFLKENLDF